MKNKMTCIEIFGRQEYIGTREGHLICDGEVLITFSHRIDKIKKVKNYLLIKSRNLFVYNIKKNYFYDTVFNVIDFCVKGSEIHAIDHNFYYIWKDIFKNNTPKIHNIQDNMSPYRIICFPSGKIYCIEIDYIYQIIKPTKYRYLKDIGKFTQLTEENGELVIYPREILNIIIEYCYTIWNGFNIKVTFNGVLLFCRNDDVLAEYPLNECYEYISDIRQVNENTCVVITNCGLKRIILPSIICGKIKPKDYLDIHFRYL